MSRIELKRGKVPTLHRRSFLAGAGVSLSLPLLEAMLPKGKTAFAQDLGSPARMLTFFTGNGVYMPAFTPAQTGADYVLSETLQPLQALKDDLLVVSGLQNIAASLKDTLISHGSIMGALLTCMPAEPYKIQMGGISMDQLAAQRIGSKTKLPSLALGLESSFNGFLDQGKYSGAYMSNLSWPSTTTPAPKLVSPVTVFETLFGAEVDNPYVKKISAQDKSVIDAVINDAKLLESQLGINDREKLQGYLNSIRELEQKLQPLGGGTLVDRSRIMNDLMVLAFEADLTRIITYMFSNSMTARIYSHLGATNNHHDLVGHSGPPMGQALDQIKKIDQYHMSELADLLLKLKQTKDVQGKSLLDSSVVQFISDIARGGSTVNYPILLAGGCNGYFKTGRHIKYDDKPPLANLYITMLEAMGVPVETFGADGTGILPDLKV